MSADWQAGDVAVCIDADGAQWGHTPIVKGQTYRVLWVGRSAQGPTALQVQQSDIDQNGAWECWRFRKLRPADPEFIEQMRSIRVSQPEEA